LAGTGREGHWAMESKRPDPIKTGSTGKLTGKGRHLVGFFELLNDVKEKVRREYCTEQLRILELIL
jgi:hypothetical protein